MNHLKLPLIAVLLFSAAAAIAQPRLASFAVGTNLSWSRLKSTSLLGLGLDATATFDNNLVFSAGYTASEAIYFDLFTPHVPDIQLQTLQTTSLVGGYRFVHRPKLVFDCMAGLSVSTYRERVIYGVEIESNGWFPVVHPLSYEQTTTQIRPELRARAHWLFTRYAGLHVGGGALLDRSTVTYLQLGLTFGKLR